MRSAFVQTLCKLAREDDRIVLICGDVGYSVLEVFSSQFPDRFLNTGIAEQNMMGVAAGLAQTGRMVFAYSIANFPVMRCYEQIRNDIAYPNLPVKIVAAGGGLAYGAQGYSHHAVEDLGIMRVLPHMTVLAPGDPVEARWATRKCAEIDGPVYLRLGRGNDATVHQKELENFELGKLVSLVYGEGATLITTGGMLTTAIAVARLCLPFLAIEVLSMPTFFPVDRANLLRTANRTSLLITLEEHGLGGLATVAAEVLAEATSFVRFLPLRLRREPSEFAGSQEDLRADHGLSVEAIVEKIKKFSL